MKEKITIKVKELAQNPATIKALQSMKPAKTIWGFLGVLFFFIVPEIIAFIWGSDITRYAKNELLSATPLMEQQYYRLLQMVFEEGGSWINLSIGIALLIWLFF